MSLPGSIPVLRRWPPFGPAVLLLFLVAVSAAIWAGTGPAGAQDGGELRVSVTADPANPEVNESTRLTATIANPPSAGGPEYDWEGSLEGGEWHSYGSSASLSWLTGEAETWAFRVTVSYASGETARSEAEAVTWSEPAPEPTPTPTPEPTQEPTPEPTQEPTPEPTQEPTPEPTQEPTPQPTQEPTPQPTQEPTPTPTPTPEPTATPPPPPAPSVARVAVTSDAGDDATYILGDVIRITLTFSENGGRNRNAAVEDRHGPGRLGREAGGLRQRQRHGQSDLHPHGGGTQLLHPGHRRAGGQPGTQRRKHQVGGV